MSSRTENVANNLMRIRKDKKLSLENVSRMTGISRSMIGQIERGMTNPTIHVVEKLAEGLQIDFFDLLGDGPSESHIWKNDDHLPKKFAAGRYSITESFEQDDRKRFRMFSIDVAAGMKIAWDNPIRDHQVFVRADKGLLVVESDRFRYEISEGDELRFRKTLGFTLVNPGLTECQCTLVYNV